MIVHSMKTENGIDCYLSSDILKEADHPPFDAPEQTPDYLAMLTAPGVPPHRLDLKIDRICAIQCNLSVEKGLMRNARVRITALHRRFVEVQLLHNLKNHCIPRTTFSFHPYRSSWTVNHKQFPLTLAYATHCS
ncbi:hypothetical protein EV424DRAFT_175541 [Suillus variegatus]|nr:hypothetical protein EV424DRAFT_175541 [Suillus variegatus]